MGFLGNFFKGLGRTVGRGIEKVGDTFGWNGVRRFGRSIQDACSERIASESSYEKRSANIYSTQRLADILADYSSGYLKQADTIEQACIDSVESYYGYLVDMMESGAGSSEQKVDLRRLKKAGSNIRKTIEGCVKGPLAKRMSIDDPECLAILKLDAGEEKRRAMADFSNKIIKEALENTIKAVRSSLDMQTREIMDHLTDMLEGEEREVTALKAQYDAVLKSSTLETEEKERECLQPLTVIYIAGLMDQLLNVM